MLTFITDIQVFNNNVTCISLHFLLGDLTFVPCQLINLSGLQFYYYFFYVFLSKLFKTMYYQGQLCDTVPQSPASNADILYGFQFKS